MDGQEFRVGLRGMRETAMKKAVSRAQPNQVAVLADDLPGGQTDVVDLLEAPVERPAQGRRPVKRSVTIRLDGDIIVWLKQHAANGRYQTEINRILREYMVAMDSQRT